MKDKDIEKRFDAIDKRLDKLVEKKIGKETFRLLKVFESRPTWAFNIKDILNEGFNNPYYYLKKLMRLCLVDRKWLKTEYKYYLISEWNKMNSQTSRNKEGKK